MTAPTRPSLRPGLRLRARSLALALALPLALGGCAHLAAPAAPQAAAAPAPAEARAALAPTGVLRVGVYPGSPTSLVTTRSGERAGVSLELGTLMAQRLGVPVKVVEFSRVAQVVEAVQAGEVDFTFTNATEARAKLVDFTPPLVRLELGYLAPAGSPIAEVGQVDRAGVRVGVSQGSSSQGALPGLLKQARVVPVPSLAEAAAQLKAGGLDLFATNKGILFELGDSLPGARVLDGRWGFEQLAIAVPKGRPAGMPWLRDFAQQVRAQGQLQAMASRAGLRGLAAD
ncbi:transporter substrate-binding domain-containing protein [Ramlibacter sp. MAHUQ-53]|uniref:transporter substrate-binding domain-containing protein n=1 Tax=unclassified Ramlibacter TaxID=2617605 RepID=UPI00362A4575